MDINLNNYNTKEMLSLLQVPEKQDHSYIELKDCLLKKITKIKNSQSKLPLKKEELIEFFINVFFKIIHSLKIPPFKKVKPSNFVKHHINDNPIPTWNTNLKAGKINPLKRKSVKKILNINTRFRTNYNKTKSTDFIYTLPYSIKKVVSMKFLTIEFPNIVYSFSDCLKSNYFYIKCMENEPILIIIDNGSYEIDDLISQINEQLTNASIVDISFTNNNKITITNNGDNDYTIIFEEKEKKKICENPCTGDLNLFGKGFAKRVVEDDIPATNRSSSQNTLKKKQKEECCEAASTKEFLAGTLGWMLGFRKASNQILAHETISANCPFDVLGTGYFLLSINDYIKNHGDTFISAFEKNLLLDNNILAKIITNSNDINCLHIKREYFGPVTLDKLEIKIYDEYGRIIDIDNCDYSFSLELELLYDL